jgi:Prenyltransferase and squalene oxidase repeat
MSRMLPSLLLLLAIALPAHAQGRAKPKDALEQSVDRALAFLAQLQEPDGAWLSYGQKSPAVTGLCLMALLSAGHVPGEGPYAEPVAKGVRWILKSQQENGLFAGDSGLEMYHHGICTLLLAEVCGMTDRTLAADLRPALEKAVRLILQAQRVEPGVFRGGWRYRPDSPDADTSITGWQLLALRAARNIGCDVPAERIEQAVGFLLRCRDGRSGAFCYQPGARPTLACTGTGILALELCGKERHRSPETLAGGGHLLKNPPRWSEEHFFYTAYYCSQAMFQLGGNYWDFYRPRLHAILFDHQQSNGGWVGNETAGPTYCTAMAVLALTVEYRLLPIYQRDEAADPK